MIRQERDTLRATLAAARRGEGAALVVRGEPGIGQSAVLDVITEAAAGFRIIRVAAAEAGPVVAWSGLHQLCAQVLDQVGRLTVAQREVLRAAFDPSAPSPDPCAAGLSLFGLLAHAAEQQPVLCVLRDVHRLDRLSRQALAAAAHRVATEPVVLLSVLPAARGAPELTGLAPTPETREALS